MEMVTSCVTKEGRVAEYVVGLIHEDHGTFGISFPDFPGCVSGGRSVDEAMQRGAETLAFHVAGMIEDGDPLPVLRSLGDLLRDRDSREEMKGALAVAVPIELPGKAVRVNISIDERLLGAIDRVAQTSGESRSAFLARAAKERLKGTG
jgi:predicted RNase H-like HicB family nuclease